MSDSTQLAITGMMLLTAMAAAYVAWRAPLSAAEMAEKMRQASESAAEQRRLRMYIFSTLMQERATIYTADATRALNLIDVVYYDCRSVREAWAELLAAQDKARNVPDHAREERLRKLLSEMAKVLGLSDQLRGDDLGRVYYPNAIADELEISALRRRAELDRLKGIVGSTSHQSEPVQSMWPPPPE